MHFPNPAFSLIAQPNHGCHGDCKSHLCLSPLPRLAWPVAHVLTSGWIQAAPVIRTINIKPNKRKPRSLDPVLLARKLEAAKREQEAALKQRERRRATRNGTFASRSATHSSDSSSTPPVSQFNAAIPPVNKNLSTCDSPTPLPRHKEWSTADGRPVMTHKSMLAALNLSLADLEAMTEKLELETTKQREYLCSRCKTPDAPGQSHNNHVHNHDSESPNYSRLRSVPTAPQFATTKHGSQTAYERVDIPEYDPPQYHAISHRGSEDVPRAMSTHQRPQIQPYDRPDWTQQSQYGADTATRANVFDVPSGYIFKRRNPQSEVAPAPARKSHIPPPPKEMHLISDAVKLMKQKERRTKRKSIADFLRKI